MRNIQEEDEPHRILIARPKRSEATKSVDRNIFASLRATQPLPRTAKITGKEYDIVGPR